MKKLINYFAALLFLCVAVSGCSSSNNDEDNNGGKDDQKPSIVKRLIKVHEGSRNYEYTYDSQGRVTQILTTSGTVYIFSYDSNSIVEDIVDSNPHDSYQVTYTLDNGRIVKVYDGDTQKTYTYNYKDGYLISETSSNRQLLYNWSNGNLMGVDYKNEKTTETYEYSSHICPPGFFPFGHYVDMCDFWGMSGYLGKTMKYLPSKVTEGNYTEIYEWTLQDGYPIKMKKTEGIGSSTIITSSSFEWR